MRFRLSPYAYRIFLCAGYVFLSNLSSESRTSNVPSVYDEDPITQYTRLIKMNPKEPILYYNRAVYHFNALSFDLSEKDIDFAIGLTNDTAITSLAWMLKNRIYTTRGEWEASRRLLTEYPDKFEKPEVVQEQLYIVDYLEWQLKAAKRSEALNDFTKCYSTSTTMLPYSPYARPVLKLYASCAFETSHFQESLVSLTTLANLNDTAPEDFLNVARFSYFYGHRGGAVASLEFLRNCTMRFPRHTECLSLAKRIKYFNSSFKLLAEKLESGDWTGLVSHLIHPTANATKSTGLLPTFDAELSLSLPAKSFDVKQISRRRITLARLLCTSTENLDLDTDLLTAWCRSVGWQAGTAAQLKKSTVEKDSGLENLKLGDGSGQPRLNYH